MSEIKKGDLVLIVSTCCELSRKYINWIGPVMTHVVVGTSVCGICESEIYGEHVELDLRSVGGRVGVTPVWWLKKIEPPGVEQRDEESEKVIA